MQIGSCYPQKPDTSCWGEGNPSSQGLVHLPLSRQGLTLFHPWGTDPPAALTLEANMLCRLATLVLILQGTVVDQLSSHLGLESEHSHPGHAVGSAGLLLLSLTFGGLCLSEQWVQASVHHKTPWVVLGLLRWLSGKESTCQCRRCGFAPYVRKIPWNKKYQPTPEPLPGNSNGQRGLVGCSRCSHKELNVTE